MEFYAFVSGVISGCVNLFLYCYYGHLATESYLMISDRLYESNWYNRPLKFQKFLIVMIQNAQQEHYFHGFGIIILNLNTYCKVWQPNYAN